MAKLWTVLALAASLVSMVTRASEALGGTNHNDTMLRR